MTNASLLTVLCLTFLFRSIGFAFSSGEKGVNAGILFPLLSLILATLMALFRDPEFATNVSQEELTLLIRQAGTFLLDSRLSSSEQLEEAKGKQMGQAINKLAVQAATGSERHTSFLALMTLQQQLVLGNVDDSVDDEFLGRLSRVVTKLFARVIREEEKVENPYLEERLDIETLLCGTEDFLAACQQAEQASQPKDRVAACRNLAETLFLSILRAHGDASSLRQHMDDLEIGSESAMGLLVTACEDELGLVGVSKAETTSALDVDVAAQPAVPSPSRQPKTPSRDVATLVSRLGSAPAGEEREAALKAIRNYKALHGDEELGAHLQQLSGTFRQFIEEQLNGVDTSVQKGSSQPAVSMSERLRQLRSRIEATEMVVQTVVEDKAAPEPAENAASSTRTPSKIPSPSAKRSSPPSKLAQPSPSKIPSPTERISKLPTSGISSAQSLRERLARKTSDSVSTAESSSNIGRAAALRARLEAVKNGKK